MRHALRKVVIVVCVLMAAGIAEKAVCPNAEASSYGMYDALETIGIATGIGTAIGLSTIAFYDSPTAHMKNALMGAGAGLIVGLGVAAYLFVSGPEELEIDPEELLPPENKPDAGKKPGKDQIKDLKKKGSSLRSFRHLASVPATSVQRDTYTPVTNGWVVALNVLELRF